MKKDTHPKYHTVKFACSCGNAFDANTVVGKAGDTIKIEICSACHPSWSGDQRIIDTEGRVDKFKNRFKSFNKSKV